MQILVKWFLLLFFEGLSCLVFLNNFLQFPSFRSNQHHPERQLINQLITKQQIANQQNTNPIIKHMPTHHPTHLHQSTQLFDLRPLQTRHFKNQVQQQKKRKLSRGISECLSSYIFSQQQNSMSGGEDESRRGFAKRQRVEREGQRGGEVRKIDKGNMMEKYRNCQKSQQNLKKNVYQFVCEMLDVFKSNASGSKEQQEKGQQQGQGGSRTRGQSERQENGLTESNKNFIIELFTELGLLKAYKSINRTFCLLVQAAQQAYYSFREHIKSDPTLLPPPCPSNHYQPTQPPSSFTEPPSSFASSHPSTCSPNFLFQTASTFFSMKKRLQEATHPHCSRLQQTLEETQRVMGYEVLERGSFVVGEEGGRGWGEGSVGGGEDGEDMKDGEQGDGCCGGSSLSSGLVFMGGSEVKQFKENVNGNGDHQQGDAEGTGIIQMHGNTHDTFMNIIHKFMKHEHQQHSK